MTEHQISYLHGESATNTDDNGPSAVVKGHKERCLSHINMVGDIDQVQSLRRGHTKEGCYITPTTVVLHYLWFSMTWWATPKAPMVPQKFKYICKTAGIDTY